MGVSLTFQRILGVRFIVGNADDAIEQISQQGGLVVVPAAPALINLSTDKQYREALLGADFALADSALMVLLWNLFQHDNIPKLSGLRYLRALIQRPDFCQQGSSFWVMPSEASSRRNVKWLNENGVHVGSQQVYLAPIYGDSIGDEVLLDQLEKQRPRHIVLGLGGGTQEQLGLYLKRNLSYKPAIHCVGAAIAFLSGDQVRIPVWVDHAGLGWLWRSASNPVAFVPRYWSARRLVPMMMQYGERMPSPPSHAIPLRTVRPRPVER